MKCLLSLLADISPELCPSDEGENGENDEAMDLLRANG